MMYLDLGEAPTIFDRFLLWSTKRPAVAWMRRADHYGESDRPLDESIRDLVAKRTGRRPSGAIRLLTNFRYFGYCFNPLSIYYCFDENEKLQDVVLEVSNTPWGERYCYVLPAGDNLSQRRHLYKFKKSFHVSPFLPMDMTYRCRLTPPGDHLYFAMENRRGEDKVFDADLSLTHEAISSASLARALTLDPLITLRVVVLIHWQALKLWLKKTPLYNKPRQSIDADAGGTLTSE